MLDLLFVRRYFISKLVCSKIFEFIHFSLVLLFQDFELSIVFFGKFFGDSVNFLNNFSLVRAFRCFKLVSQDNSCLFFLFDFLYELLNLFIFSRKLCLKFEDLFVKLLSDSLLLSSLMFIKSCFELAKILFEGATHA